MNVHTYPLGQMRANCYLLEKERKALLIDPTDSADFILQKINEKNLELVGLIATHGHFDHVMAVGELQLTYPHLPLHIHEKDLFLLKRLPETAIHFLGAQSAVLPVSGTKLIQKGQQHIDVFSFDVVETPGHTPGGVCLYFKKDGILFTGDSLFQGSVGRYDFSYSDKARLKDSLQTILSYPDETLVYSGHGEETRIEYEHDTFTQFFGTV